MHHLSGYVAYFIILILFSYHLVNHVSVLRLFYALLIGICGLFVLSAAQLFDLLIVIRLIFVFDSSSYGSSAHPLVR